MRKVIYKLFTDYEKEENWLNEMSAKGLAFEDYTLGRYAFSDCKPGEYIYRLELLENLPRNPESQKYLSFMAESGAEPVASWFRWIYFRKKAEDGPFDIYSDIDSKIAHFRRIMWLFFPLMCLNFLFGFINLRNGISYFVQDIHAQASDSPSILVIGVMGICVGLVLFFPWNNTRRKVKKLKADKLLSE